MPAQKPSSPSSPADADPQGSPSGGSPPEAPPDPQPTPPDPPPVPQTFSGIWWQEEDPQFLIQWTLSPASPPPSSPTAPQFAAAPAPPVQPASPAYQAHVAIFQEVFDVTFPNPFQPGPVPFSLSDPTVGPNPYLQGSLVLTQGTVPTLQVMNLQFPGFRAMTVPLFPSPSSPGSDGGGSGSPTAGSSSGGQDGAGET